MTRDPSDPLPLVELKQHLLLFVEQPPGPKSARKVYDIWQSYCGDVFRKYKSTLPVSFLEDWTQGTRRNFEQVLLPALRTQAEWGYGLADGKPVDAWLFMFHGFRPVSEPGMASFYRFEFDWQVNSAFLRGLAEILLQEVPFLSGYGGYFLQGRPGTRHAGTSYDRIFALAMRYWGLEVEDIELTAAQMKKGYKCVNWLTMIGAPFYAEHRTAINQAKSVAPDYVESPLGTLLQASDAPLMLDRNRVANMDGYVAIARALLPLQITEHDDFPGKRWSDDDATMAWIRRFTDERGVV